MTKYVACGDFVKRQTPESGFSHYEGTWSELEWLVEYYFIDLKVYRQGYKPGVVLVDLPAKGFMSALVKLDMFDKLTASYSPRRITEAPHIRVSVAADKQPAKYVSVVLYSKDVLDENNEATTDAEWEIVCIKARVTEEEEPMDPYTMARNFLHLEGGTKGDFTAQQFAESIVYWNNHAMSTGKKLNWLEKLCKRVGETGCHFWKTLPERERL